MTKDEQTQVITDNPILGCAGCLALFSLFLAVPLLLFGWLFGNETTLRLGIGFLLWPIVTLVGFRLVTWAMKVIVKVLGI